METRNRAEAERAIRENRRLHQAPEEIDRRMDTVGRSKPKRVKSLIDQQLPETEPEQFPEGIESHPHPKSGAVPLSDEEGLHGYAERVFGTEAYENAPEAVVFLDEEEEPPPSAVFNPNDEMAGQGWTPPTRADSGWEHPDEPATEDRLHEAETPDAD